MMTNRSQLSGIVFLVLVSTLCAAEIHPGLLWTDDEGKPLHAHAGNIVKAGDTWYWYGENTRNLASSAPYGGFNGITCYSSQDLQTWHNEGVVLSVRESGPLSTSGVAYRPKVLYHAASSTFVMLCTECCTLPNGIVFSTSADPTGPFEYQSKWTGAGPYDMGAFVDDDGTAYVIFADGNRALSIRRLGEDYLSVETEVWRAGNGCEEAPAITKIGGRYFVTNSHCSYWMSNQNAYRSSTDIAGPYGSAGNLGNGNSFDSQGGFILTVTGSSGTVYIYMGDRWDCPQNHCDLSMSKYVWLPLEISGSTITMNWYDTWYLDPYAGVWSSDPLAVAAAVGGRSADKKPGGMLTICGTKIRVCAGESHRVTFFSARGERLGSTTGVGNRTIDLPRYTGMNMVRMQTESGSVFTKTIVSVSDW